MQKQTIREDLHALPKAKSCKNCGNVQFWGAEGAAGAVRVREAAAE